MRLSLKRQPGAVPRKPLRDRIDEARASLADTKVRAGRALAVAKILMKPEAPKPAPVDRVALVNYITFLALERNQASAELYPHMSARNRRFVLSMNAAWRFFRDGNNSLKPNKNLAPAATRALRVLDLVGIDWREDTDADDRLRFDDVGRADTGERPKHPFGSPSIDAALLEALDDLMRLDAAQIAMNSAGDEDRAGDTAPGYGDLEGWRDDALARLAKGRADSLTGLQAKARALLTRSVSDLPSEAFKDIAASLAHDLLGAYPKAIAPRLDPILAAIAENERLEAEADAFERTIPGNQDVPPDACHAVMAHFHDVVLKTVPTTAEGCKALARFVPAFFDRWGQDLDDAAPAAFALIARSPLL